MSASCLTPSFLLSAKKRVQPSIAVSWQHKSLHFPSAATQFLKKSPSITPPPHGSLPVLQIYVSSSSFSPTPFVLPNGTKFIWAYSNCRGPYEAEIIWAYRQQGSYWHWVYLSYKQLQWYGDITTWLQQWHKYTRIFTRAGYKYTTDNSLAVIQSDSYCYRISYCDASQNDTSFQVFSVPVTKWLSTRPSNPLAVD
jgi:hypothetical protein